MAAVTGTNPPCRWAVLAVTGVSLAGTVLLSAGCSTTKPAQEAPPSSTAKVTPTDKGVLAPPPKAFNQNMNAAEGISALESEGYNVEINWGGGRSDQNLALCRIGSVDGLRGSGAVKPGTSVYVTVIC